MDVTIIVGTYGGSEWSTLAQRAIQSAKKQTVVAASTGEAEYYAAEYCGREVLWLRQLLMELGHLPTVSPPSTPFQMDNTAALQMMDNPDEVSNRTKHISITYHDQVGNL